jgi:hypothetical protein
MFRRHSLCVLLSYITDAYNCVLYVKEFLHSVFIVNKNFKIQIEKSSDYNIVYICRINICALSGWQYIHRWGAAASLTAKCIYISQYQTLSVLLLYLTARLNSCFYSNGKFK